jgi:O-antigen ligase
MKKLFIIQDNLENKITYVHLLGFLCTLPFNRLYSELFLISLFLHTLISLTRKKISWIRWKETLLMQSVYILTIIGTIYTMHRSIAFGLWEKQLAILLFPLIFFLNTIDLKKYTKPLLYAFALVNILVILYLYYDAFSIILYYNMEWNAILSGLFLNHKFSSPIDIHATYLSLYCALSLVTVLSFFLTNKRTNKEKLLATAALIILTLGLLQLGSRAVLVGLMAVIIFIIPYFIQNSRARKTFTLLALGTTLLIAAGIYVSDGLNYRYIKSLKNDLSIENVAYTLSDPRAERWELAWDLVQKKPLAGYGTGDEVPLLKEKYFEHRFYDSYLHELNAHNQYLSFLIKGGVIALAVFLFTLYYFFRLAIKTRNLFFASFLLLFMVVGFSENILNVNKGIFLYAFFLSFYACGELKRRGIPEEKAMTGNPELKNTVFITKELTI